MVKVTGETHLAFSSREILDAILTTNKMVGAVSKKGKGGVLHKFNPEQAYDHVDSNFLIYSLQHMGFGSKPCWWI